MKRAPIFVAILLAHGMHAAEPTAAPAKPLLEKLPRIPPKSPAEAAQTFRVLDGFSMELLAAEPLVASPVATTYDENGRAFVCEMRDYPYTDKAHHKPNQENPTDAPIGRVRLLEDTNGDGVFDKATVFADGLSWPTGAACWKGGLFVAATPDIWYFKDTDGDGVADVRRKVFTGFRKFNVQAVMNNLVWGLDNRIHGAGGSNGGELRAADAPDAKPLVLSHADFAFDPVTGKLELLSGGARFGGSFDDWGHRFLCNIRNPAQHIVLPGRYLARNPWLTPQSPLNDMAESGDQLPVHRISEPEPWRVLRAKRWAGERDIVMPRSELVGAGVVTSASGVTSYRGGAYPEKYRGNVFVCECAGNLFYRLQLTADGPTFKAARVDGDREMVASTDNWFRPVNFVNAPDGTLHVLDMYRENIEHPWSIPEDIHAAVDLEAGRDMGRIWRLAPPNFHAPSPPRLGSAGTAELVAALDNPNSWWRETAQRLLVERQDRSAAAGLRALARGSGTPQGRVHALWALEGLGELMTADLREALIHSQPGVCENALRLAESRLNDDPALGSIVREMAFTTLPAAVEFQVALTLGEMKDPRAVDGLTAIAKRFPEDRWIRTAILSSAANCADQLLSRLLPSAAYSGERQLAQIVGARGKPAEISAVVRAAIAPAGERMGLARQVLAGLAEGYRRYGRSLRDAGLDQEAAQAVNRAFDEAARIAGEVKSSPDQDRVVAIQLLASDAFERVRQTLAGLLAKDQSQEVQRAAIAAIASFNRPETAPMLLAHWNEFTPAIRGEVVVAMLGNRVRILPLLEAVERGDIPANQVPFARRAVLLRSTDPKVKEIATRLFVEAAGASRKEVIEKYQPALEMKGDAARGRKVFEAACAVCHRAGDLGNDVGPNLATIRQWNPEQVLINVLDPNREVAPNFLNHIVETKDGRTLSGIVAGENPYSLTLKPAGGAEVTLMREQIESIVGSKQSLMPEGLEAVVNVGQMADLIAFLLGDSASR